MSNVNSFSQWILFGVGAVFALLSFFLIVNTIGWAVRGVSVGVGFIFLRLSFIVIWAVLAYLILIAHFHIGS